MARFGRSQSFRPVIKHAVQARSPLIAEAGLLVVTQNSTNATRVFAVGSSIQTRILLTNVGYFIATGSTNLYSIFDRNTDGTIALDSSVSVNSSFSLTGAGNLVFLPSLSAHTKMYLNSTSNITLIPHLDLLSKFDLLSTQSILVDSEASLNTRAVLPGASNIVVFPSWGTHGRAIFSSNPSLRLSPTSDLLCRSNVGQIANLRQDSTSSLNIGTILVGGIALVFDQQASLLSKSDLDRLPLLINSARTNLNSNFDLLIASSITSSPFINLLSRAISTSISGLIANGTSLLANTTNIGALGVLEQDGQLNLLSTIDMSGVPQLIGLGTVNLNNNFDLLSGGFRITDTHSALLSLFIIPVVGSVSATGASLASLLSRSVINSISTEILAGSIILQSPFILTDTAWLTKYVSSNLLSQCQLTASPLRISLAFTSLNTGCALDGSASLVISNTISLLNRFLAPSGAFKIADVGTVLSSSSSVLGSSTRIIYSSTAQNVETSVSFIRDLTAINLSSILGVNTHFTASPNLVCNCVVELDSRFLTEQNSSLLQSGLKKLYLVVKKYTGIDMRFDLKLNRTLDRTVNIEQVINKDA